MITIFIIYRCHSNRLTIRYTQLHVGRVKFIRIYKIRLIQSLYHLLLCNDANAQPECGIIVIILIACNMLIGYPWYWHRVIAVLATDTIVCCSDATWLFAHHFIKLRISYPLEGKSTVYRLILLTKEQIFEKGFPCQCTTMQLSS